jgi:hypothetical protein
MKLTYRDKLPRDLTPAEVDANFRFLAGPLGIAAGSGYTAFGDSITEVPDFRQLGYAPLLGALIGGQFTNRGLAGTTIFQGLNTLYANATVDLLPGRTGLASLAFGVNDWRSYKNDSDNAYFLRAVRLLLELAFAREVIEADNLAIIYSAGWSASSFNPGTQVRSGNRVLHASGSEVATLVVEDTDNCTVVLYTSNDPFQTDTVNIYVDGQLYTTVNPKAMVPPAGAGSVPVFLRFARKASTQIRVENGNPSFNTFLDYALVRRAATAESAPFLVFAAPNIADSERNGLTQSQWDALNERTRKVVQQYQREGYPVRWVDLNVEYDYTVPNTKDGVHPTAQTHRAVLLYNVLSAITIL